MGTMLQVRQLASHLMQLLNDNTNSDEKLQSVQVFSGSVRYCGDVQEVQVVVASKQVLQPGWQGVQRPVLG